MIDPQPLTDHDIAGLLFLLGRLRGPGNTDPELPVDPDNERHSPGVRAWANDRMIELVDARDRRRTARPAGGIAQIVTDDD